MARLDPLALVVMADTMPGAVGEKLGPQHRHGWFAPSVDLTFHLLGSCRSEWVFAHNLARHAGHGYASAEMALWAFGPDGHDDGRLVAYAYAVRAGAWVFPTGHDAFDFHHSALYRRHFVPAEIRKASFEGVDMRVGQSCETRHQLSGIFVLREISVVLSRIQRYSDMPLRRQHVAYIGCYTVLFVRHRVYTS